MKKLKIFIIIILGIMFVPIAINFYVVFSNLNDIYSINDINESYDIALILGCSVLKNNQPSKMLRDRLNAGIDLYNQNKVSKILISGDHQDGYSEVDVMYNYLIDNFIPEIDILIDYEGFSTGESLINFKNNYNDETVIIVTQKYHLYRSLNIADSLNLDAVGVNAKLVNYGGQTFREIREILARNKDFIKFLIY